MGASDLDAYLGRIGFAANPRVDLETLRAVHRAHALAVPYENVDIQLGRGSKLGEDAFRAKLVGEGRGGWCYENNGLLTWALREIGFEVTRVAGAVGRDVRGEAADGNHLVGLVDLDRRYVVDCGLGDGPLEPFALHEGRFREEPCEFGLERIDARWWRFHNQELGFARSFDFDEIPRELAWYDARCSELQTSPDSTFIKFLIVIRRHERGYRALFETTAIETHDDVRSDRRLDDGGEFRRVLTGLLGRDLGADADRLWQHVSARVAERERAAARS